jgi:cobalamin biosynthesis protein CobT
MSDSQNIPEENNVVQDNTYESLGTWFTAGTDTPLPLRTLLYDMNAEKKGDNKLTDEELEQILSFVEIMSEKAPNIDVEITPLVYFIKHLNRTKDVVTTMIKEDEVKEDKKDSVDMIVSEEEEKEEEQKASDKEEEQKASDEEADQEDQEDETNEDADDEEEEESEEETEETEEENSIPHKNMQTVLISNTQIDIPFPITCTFTILMMLYSIQLGLFFCRLIGCNYLEYSHDEL